MSTVESTGAPTSISWTPTWCDSVPLASMTRHALHCSFTFSRSPCFEDPSHLGCRPLLSFSFVSENLKYLGLKYKAYIPMFKLYKITTCASLQYYMAKWKSLLTQKKIQAWTVKFKETAPSQTHRAKYQWLCQNKINTLFFSPQINSHTDEPERLGQYNKPPGKAPHLPSASQTPLSTQDILGRDQHQGWPRKSWVENVWVWTDLAMPEQLQCLPQDLQQRDGKGFLPQQLCSLPDCPHVTWLNCTNSTTWNAN